MENFLVDLVRDTFADAAVDGAVPIRVNRFQLKMPLDVRLTAEGEVVADVPEGRMATGFSTAPGRLTALLQAPEGVGS